jgi:hypothetical protein
LGKDKKSNTPDNTASIILRCSKPSFPKTVLVFCMVLSRNYFCLIPGAKPGPVKPPAFPERHLSSEKEEKTPSGSIE